MDKGRGAECALAEENGNGGANNRSLDGTMCVRGKARLRNLLRKIRSILRDMQPDVSQSVNYSSPITNLLSISTAQLDATQHHDFVGTWDHRAVSSANCPLEKVSANGYQTAEVLDRAAFIAGFVVVWAQSAGTAGTASHGRLGASSVTAATWEGLSSSESSVLLGTCSHIDTSMVSSSYTMAC
jgi:hypothetical protein